MDADSDLIAYLRRHNTACPACGYQLRALTTTRCPECGEHITIAKLIHHSGEGSRRRVGCIAAGLSIAYATFVGLPLTYIFVSTLVPTLHHLTGGGGANGIIGFNIVLLLFVGICGPGVSALLLVLMFKNAPKRRRMRSTRHGPEKNDPAS